MEQLANPQRTVLFVDDDETTREAVAELLEEEGYRVVTAVDGERALELFDAVRPSLVVTDLEMPKVRGDQLARQIRERSPDTPVVLVSGLRPRDAERLAREAGADAFLMKPLDVGTFLDLLSSYC